MNLFKLTITVLICALSLSVHPVLASEPSTTAEPWTYTEFGSSSWTYADSRDSTRKTEGSYAAFLAANGRNADGRLRSDNTGTYSTTSAPAGGSHANLSGDLYATTGNQCKTCHASHRAGGAFKLTRSNTAEDSCSYCHVDDHRHADSQAYTNEDGIYASNGHTMGASRDIPSSSVRQWLETLTLTSTTGTPTTWDIRIRRYDSRRLKLFSYTGVGSSAHADGLGQLERYGPTLLTCISCHQPHNASNLIWKPPGAPSGYKLLRASPSGSLMTSDTAYDPLTYNGRVDPSALEPGAVVKVPEENFGPENTGHNLGKNATRDDSQTSGAVYTSWTQWKGTTETVSPEALSVWCADCHNLEMAANDKPADDATAEAFKVAKRGKYHGDRTHTSGTRLTPCYSCHRASGDGGRISGNSPNWEATATPDSIGNADCDRCHYRSGKYALDNPVNDFPHSGAPTSTKLLFDWYDADSGLDQVCRYCHNKVEG